MPERRNFVTDKRPFALKQSNKGESFKHEARYVATGFEKDKQSDDYNQSYSPTVEVVTLLVSLKLAAQKS